MLPKQQRYSLGCSLGFYGALEICILLLLLLYLVLNAARSQLNKCMLNSRNGQCQYLKQYVVKK